MYMLRGMPAGRRELARLAVPLMGALPLFDLYLMPFELLLALGKLAAQMPLHALGETDGLKTCLLLVQVNQHRLPSGRSALRGTRDRRTCGSGSRNEPASGADRNQDRGSQQPPG